MKYLALILLAACSNNSTPQKNDAAGTTKHDASTVDSKPIDAAIDAPPDATTNVVTIACPPAPVMTVTTSGMAYAYAPAHNAIAQGDIVEFMMPSIHDVTPNATGSDPGIHVPFGQTECKQFLAKGTFGFYCSLHGFSGSITVQ